ncbi:hypothetical protein AAFF_G00277730 [Aldrovandia affinis]|uniref:DDE Tnp4 domain-containing protein n=1 Tax=Aldrovandia affinis TaxID=143900 RepID=A0AAD7RA52_9TELE|nr:hypothetical protein AAFF_G00277730 [Aldrovandia affinis]
MICNSDCVLTNIVAKWPGSAHDSRIFRTSTDAQRLAQGEISRMLLGDTGYTCQPYLMTPYPDPGIVPQMNYNRAHSSTRGCIEMAFGQIRSRFNCLRHLRVAPDRACDIIVAFAVLHNVAKLRREREPPLEPMEEMPPLNPMHLDHRNGTVQRDLIAINHFQ